MKKIITLCLLAFIGLTTVNAQNTLDKLGLTSSNTSRTAFSLRKLSSTYAGSAIQVRRSSNNNTQDIGFTSNGDLDTSSLKTFVGNGNGFITIWYDQSGNVRNATQGTALSQPQIINAGVIYRKNNIPTIFFNDTKLATASFNGAFASGFSLAICAGVNLNRQYSTFGGKTNNNQPNPFDFYNNICYYGNGSGSSAVDLQRSISNKYGYSQWVFTANTTTYANFIEGASNGSGAMNSAYGDANTPLVLGSRADGVTQLNGWIGEFVSFGSVLSTTARQSVEGNQKLYYNINNAFLFPTWTGATNTNWNTASNWSTNAIPDASSTITIPTGLTNYPVISGGANAFAYGLLIETGATLTLNANSNLTINDFFNESSLAAMNINGILNNAGKITIGAIANPRLSYGMEIYGAVDNSVGGEINLYNSLNEALISYAGSNITNAGKINIGSASDVVGRGISSESDFINTASGEIKIDNTDNVAFNNVGGTFTNSGKLTIGSVAVVNSAGISSQSSFVNNVSGEIKIDNMINGGTGFQNVGTFTNSGKLTIGSLTAIGGVGLDNVGDFTNNAGGEIKIDNTGDFAVDNGGLFTNSGKLTIGSMVSCYSGITGGGDFTNNAGGEIKIDNISGGGYGIILEAPLTNAGIINIGSIASGGVYGIFVRANLTNSATGEITINRTTSIGLNIIGSGRTFTNNGKLTIGSIAIAGLGVSSAGNFNNNACATALVLAGGFKVTSGTATNSGYLQVNNTLNKTAGTVTNNGVLKYGSLSGSIVNTNNAAVIVNNNPTPIFTYGGTYNGTINGIFTDAATTISAGSFTAPNSLTTSSNTAGGLQTLYAKITPSGGSCSYSVPFTYIAPYNITICISELPYSWNGLTFNAAGTQIAHLTKVGGGDSALTLVLTVNPQVANPTISISANTNNVCANNAVTITTTTTNGGTAPNYNFKVNNASKQNGFGNTFTSNTLANNDVVTCVITRTDGCANTVSSNSVNMIIKSTPAVPLFTSGTILNCTLGTSSLLYSNSWYGTWLSSDPSIATLTANSGASIKVNAISNGTTNISYTLTDAITGCTSSVATTYTVASIPVAPIVSPSTSCSGGTTFQATNATGGGVWASENNRQSISNTGLVITSYTSGIGLISYTVTNSTTGCSKKVIKSYTLFAQPAYPGVSVFPAIGNSNAICNNKDFQFTGSPVGGIWTTTATSGIATISVGGLLHTVGAGSATLNYRITDANGCSSNRSFIGTIINCFARATNSSVTQSTNTSFNLFPNPAKGVVSLQVDRLIGSGTVVITDVYGKTIKSYALRQAQGDTNVQTLDISTLSKGIYLVNVITSEGKTTKKLIVN